MLVLKCFLGGCVVIVFYPLFFPKMVVFGFLKKKFQGGNSFLEGASTNKTQGFAVSLRLVGIGRERSAQKKRKKKREQISLNTREEGGVLGEEDGSWALK